METNSKESSARRQRGKRPGGRGRSRQENPQGNTSNGRGRNRGRKRNRNSGDAKPPKQTPLQKLLSTLTFGLLGSPKAKASPKSAARPSRNRTETVSPKSESERRPSPARREGEVKTPKRNRSEVTSNRLYVGNLDYATGEPELEELFRGVGNVLSAEVVTNPRTQQSKGFAFVEMGSLEEAKRAVSVLDDQEFMGRKLIVSGARGEGQSESPDENALAETASEPRL